MESVWSIQKRIYAVVPEEALSMGSNTIPRKKLHHGELQAKSTCHELASFRQALTQELGDEAGHQCGPTTGYVSI